jgi:hypothetical protein
MQDLIDPGLSLLCKAIYILANPQEGGAKFAFAVAEQLAHYGVKQFLESRSLESTSLESKLADILDAFGGAQMKTASDFLRHAAAEISPEGKQIHRIAAGTNAVSAYNTYIQQLNYSGATKAAVVAAEIFRDLNVTPVASREYAALAKEHEETHYQTSKNSAFAQLPSYEYNWEWAEEWSQNGARAMMTRYEPNIAAKFIGTACAWVAGGVAGATAAGVKGGIQHIKYAITIEKAKEEYHSYVAKLDKEKADVIRVCNELLKV